MPAPSACRASLNPIHLPAGPHINLHVALISDPPRTSQPLGCPVQPGSDIPQGLLPRLFLPAPFPTAAPASLCPYFSWKPRRIRAAACSHPLTASLQSAPCRPPRRLRCFPQNSPVWEEVPLTPLVAVIILSPFSWFATQPPQNCAL